MTAYDKLYQKEGLFGEACPELIEFFAGQSRKGKMLDLGCGQGRDAIPLARMGYQVIGIDASRVGIEQMISRAKKEGLKLKGLVRDIYKLDKFDEYEYILLDSMFHFQKNDRKKEISFLQRILAGLTSNGILVLCIQDSGKKVDILKETIESIPGISRLLDMPFIYTFTDHRSGHSSISDYRMMAYQKEGKV